MIGVISTLGISVLSDRKAYRKIEGMIGRLDNITLSGQHNEINHSIVHRHNEVIQKVNDQASILAGTSRDILLKVEIIKSSLDRNEGRYENLSADQREMRNNVLRLVESYEKLVDENKMLREENNRLNHQIELMRQVYTEEMHIHESELER